MKTSTLTLMLRTRDFNKSWIDIEVDSPLDIKNAYNEKIYPALCVLCAEQGIGVTHAAG